MFVIQGYSEACSKASIRAHAHLDGGIGLRPGGNVTGIAILMEETTSKRFQLLREMVPKAARVAFIWNAPAKKQLESADVAARKLGVRLLSFEVNTADALPDAFDAAAKGGADR